MEERIGRIELSHNLRKESSHDNSPRKRFLSEKQALTREVKSSVNLHEELDNERKRLETEGNQNPLQKGNKFRVLTKESEKSESIFHTEIADYKSKIARMREAKELKKRKLEVELSRVNRELESIKKKEEEVGGPAGSQANNYESRVKISDNANAKVKAERFIKDLRSQKRNRQNAKIGEFGKVDENINRYMEELMKERYKNEEKIRQKKKLEIIERMKQQELRKISEQKKKEGTVQFVAHLKHHPSIPKISDLHPPNKPNTNKQAESEQFSQHRSPTKRSEAVEEVEMTPELSKKKAYLNKLRNFSVKKEKKDLYEQALS